MPTEQVGAGRKPYLGSPPAVGDAKRVRTLGAAVSGTEAGSLRTLHRPRATGHDARPSPMPSTFLPPRLCLRRVLLLGTILAVGTSAACAPSLLDMAALKAAIQGKIGEVDVKVSKVECPPERELRSGDRFDCTAIAESGVAITAKVEQQDGNGKVFFQIGNELYATDKVTEQIHTLLLNQGAKEATVTCPKGIAVAGGSGTLECSAKVDGADVLVRVPITDGTAQLDPAEIVKK